MIKEQRLDENSSAVVGSKPEEKSDQEIELRNIIDMPQWFENFIANTLEDEIIEMGNDTDLTISKLSDKLGGDVESLPHEYLIMILPKGSASGEIAELLRTKREEYLVDYPEEAIGRGASEGIVGCDGVVMPIWKYNLLSPGEKFDHLLGRTCFHRESGTPGYGDNVNRRVSETQDRSGERGRWDA